MAIETELDQTRANFWNNRSRNSKGKLVYPITQEEKDQIKTLEKDTTAVGKRKLKNLKDSIADRYIEQYGSLLAPPRNEAEARELAWKNVQKEKPKAATIVRLVPHKKEDYIDEYLENNSHLRAQFSEPPATPETKASKPAKTSTPAPASGSTPPPPPASPTPETPPTEGPVSASPETPPDTLTQIQQYAKQNQNMIAKIFTGQRDPGDVTNELDELIRRHNAENPSDPLPTIEEIYNAGSREESLGRMSKLGKAINPQADTSGISISEPENPKERAPRGSRKKDAAQQEPAAPPPPDTSALDAREKAATEALQKALAANDEPAAMNAIEEINRITNERIQLNAAASSAETSSNPLANAIQRVANESGSAGTVNAGSTPNAPAQAAVQRLAEETSPGTATTATESRVGDSRIDRANKLLDAIRQQQKTVEDVRQNATKVPVPGAAEGTYTYDKESNFKLRRSEQNLADTVQDFNLLAEDLQIPPFYTTTVQPIGGSGDRVFARVQTNNHENYSGSTLDTLNPWASDSTTLPPNSSPNAVRTGWYQNNNQAIDEGRKLLKEARSGSQGSTSPGEAETSSGTANAEGAAIQRLASGNEAGAGTSSGAAVQNAVQHLANGTEPGTVQTLPEILRGTGYANQQEGNNRILSTIANEKLNKIKDLYENISALEGARQDSSKLKNDVYNEIREFDETAEHLGIPKYYSKFYKQNSNYDFSKTIDDPINANKNAFETAIYRTYPEYSIEKINSIANHLKNGTEYNGYRPLPYSPGSNVKDAAWEHHTKLTAANESGAVAGAAQGNPTQSAAQRLASETSTGAGGAQLQNASQGGTINQQSSSGASQQGASGSASASSVGATTSQGGSQNVSKKSRKPAKTTTPPASIQGAAQTIVNQGTPAASTGTGAPVGQGAPTSTPPSGTGAPSTGAGAPSTGTGAPAAPPSGGAPSTGTGTNPPTNPILSSTKYPGVSTSPPGGPVSSPQQRAITRYVINASGSPPSGGGGGVTPPTPPSSSSSSSSAPQSLFRRRAPGSSGGGAGGGGGVTPPTPPTAPDEGLVARLFEGIGGLKSNPNWRGTVGASGALQGLGALANPLADLYHGDVPKAIEDLGWTGAGALTTAAGAKALAKLAGKGTAEAVLGKMVPAFGIGSGLTQYLEDYFPQYRKFEKDHPWLSMAATPVLGLGGLAAATALGPEAAALAGIASLLGSGYSTARTFQKAFGEPEGGISLDPTYYSRLGSLRPGEAGYVANSPLGTQGHSHQDYINEITQGLHEANLQSRAGNKKGYQSSIDQMFGNLRQENLDDAMIKRLLSETLQKTGTDVPLPGEKGESGQRHWMGNKYLPPAPEIPHYTRSID